MAMPLMVPPGRMWRGSAFMRTRALRGPTSSTMKLRPPEWICGKRASIRCSIRSTSSRGIAEVGIDMAVASAFCHARTSGRKPALCAQDRQARTTHAASASPFHRGFCGRCTRIRRRSCDGASAAEADQTDGEAGRRLHQRPQGDRGGGRQGVGRQAGRRRRGAARCDRQAIRFQGPQRVRRRCHQHRHGDVRHRSADQAVHRSADPGEEGAGRRHGRQDVVRQGKKAAGRGPDRAAEDGAADPTPEQRRSCQEILRQDRAVAAIAGRGAMPAREAVPATAAVGRAEETSEAGGLVESDRRLPGVLVLTLARPQTRNALSQAMLAALQGSIDAASADAGVRAIVIAAKGTTFCAGHDLKELSAHRSDADGGRAFTVRLMGECSNLMRSIVRCPKPVIAAVEGVATAAGCQLVATCDLAAASVTARFATPGVNIGLFCSTPMVALARNVPRKRAMEMLLLGEMLGPYEAAEYGLVNRVVVEGQALEAALDFARTLASKPPVTLAIGKEAFYRQLEMCLADAYDYASAVMVENMMHRESREGIGAFLEKRTPDWEKS